MANSTIIHGVFLDIFAKGVLLIGESGMGKSDLALELIDRGHALIADDAPNFQLLDNRLIGSCPKILQNFLAIRDIGIINVEEIFSREAIKAKKRLDLVIEIVKTNISNDETHLLNGSIDTITIMGLKIPKVKLVKQTSRNMALLTEVATKKFLANSNKVAHNFRFAVT